MNQRILLTINDKIYLKDPQSSDLGKKIVQESIALIYDIGFEAFTFKKLANSIQTSEASIYRYFKDKHFLLSYLVVWYWSWREYRLAIELSNLNDPLDRLERAIRVLCEEIKEDSEFSEINEVQLHQIMISEGIKVYFSKKVDQDNKEGFFLRYKELMHRVASIILEINPEYKYPHILVSTVIDGAHHQRFYAQHLPRLTDTVDGEDAVVEFALCTIKNAINVK